MNKEQLIDKYNLPAPRYTSYPTVPMWGNKRIEQAEWMTMVKKIFEESNTTKGVSIYIHLPYCEKLCTFCACTKKITSKHNVEIPYVRALINEWKIYTQVFDSTPIIKELHLGGGTPTFFSPENLKIIIESILEKSVISDNNDFSFETNPNDTSKEHLQTLYNLGFKRVSFGVQDFNYEVQKFVRRIHSFEKVQKVTQYARDIGYTAINYDLIYGLPKQNVSTVEETIKKVTLLNPDRIAFYSFAYVPWVAKSQKILSKEDIPDSVEKRKLYEKGKELLLNSGYMDIGMDHFALKTDKLYIASQQGTLHRNFMGYNTTETDLLIGLGVSAISEAKYGYVQNTKQIGEYTNSVANHKFNFERGCLLSDEDLLIKKAILNIVCKRKLTLTPELERYLPLQVFRELKQMEQEKIIEIKNKNITVTNLGMIFLRNICVIFDNKLRNYKLNKQTFSKAI